MSDDNRPLGVSEVLEMNPGDWINEGVLAIVRKIEPSQPTAKKKFWRCDLGDTVNRSADISLTLFFAPKFAAGDVIEITGKGIKRDEFNGYPRISIGKSSEVHVRERGNARSSSPPPSNNHPPDRGAPTDEGASSPPAAAPGSAEKHAPYMNGQTIGMAMKEAIALVVSSYPAIDDALLADPHFWRQVFETSSDILRVSHHLANGHLAPAAKDRRPSNSANPPAAAGNSKAANAGKAPAAAQENIDEDVPF